MSQPDVSPASSSVIAAREARTVANSSENDFFVRNLVDAHRTQEWRKSEKYLN